MKTLTTIQIPNGLQKQRIIMIKFLNTPLGAVIAILFSAVIDALAARYELNLVQTLLIVAFVIFIIAGLVYIDRNDDDDGIGNTMPLDSVV